MAISLLFELERKDIRIFHYETQLYGFASEVGGFTISLPGYTLIDIIAVESPAVVEREVGYARIPHMALRFRVYRVYNRGSVRRLGFVPTDGSMGIQWVKGKMLLCVWSSTAL